MIYDLYYMIAFRLHDSNFSSRTQFSYFNVIQLSRVLHCHRIHLNRLLPAISSAILYHPWLSAPLASSRPDLSAVIILLHLGWIDSREPAQLIQGHFHVISFYSCTRPWDYGTRLSQPTCHKYITLDDFLHFFPLTSSFLDSIAKWLLLPFHFKHLGVLFFIYVISYYLLMAGPWWSSKLEKRTDSGDT